ncbi:MAG: AAA family ATPase [Clostridia bacterium]|nr:AAA family ATPase [Clostridia bacterium]
MILKRKIYDKLLAWKQNSNGKSALLIEGARRVGKTTVVTEFAKNEYKSCIIIDFAHVESRIIQVFENHRANLNDFFMLLSIECNTRLYVRDSVIVFDEVQEYPVARELIKYLVADGRYDYIETGSLISIQENVKNIVIPSEEHDVKMYPLDFEEFCLACNSDMLVEYIHTCFEQRIPLERGLHNKAIHLFKQYLLTGGMPQAVVAFLDGNLDYEAADEAKRGIISLYRKDIFTINQRYKSKVASIFDQIPGFLSKHEKRVVLSDISQGTGIDQYADTFFWLGNSMICNECFRAENPRFGLAINETRSSIKCYMGDTGLLVTRAIDENVIASNELYQKIYRGTLSMNEGMFFENVAAQMLVAKGYKLFFYTEYNEKKHKNDTEIDFLIPDRNNPGKISPLEVKSGKKYTTVSFDRFREKFKDSIGTSYVISSKNLSVTEDGIIHIPIYMTMCL